MPGAAEAPVTFSATPPPNPTHTCQLSVLSTGQWPEEEGEELRECDYREDKAERLEGRRRSVLVWSHATPPPHVGDHWVWPHASRPPHPASNHINCKEILPIMILLGDQVANFICYNFQRHKLISSTTSVFHQNSSEHLISDGSSIRRSFEGNYFSFSEFRGHKNWPAGALWSTSL